MQERLKGSRDWSLPAVITSLNRLVDKGFLACERRRGLIDRLYGSSFTGMVASLYDGRAIGRDDLEELRQYLDELEGK